ncbi:MAG: SsrA-binding protein SmpB [Maioricimonas sp. JB045]|uniref:SsrA-binding protein SmpB n=1 Tax=Maioricimonas sp. JC845 TaxID=3232138 RepID=UPI00345A5CE0
MAGKKSKSKSGKKNDDRFVCRNRRARHEYEILDSIECGIVLTGSEVKSVRDHKVSIEEAYGKVERGEVWLIGCDIAQYPQATIMNHEPRRTRKLLLSRREIRKFAEAAEQQGLTLVPLDVHFSDRGLVKVTLSVARGRKLHDKREHLKKETAKKEIREAIRARRS